MRLCVGIAVVETLMQLRVFKGSSIAQVLAQVKAELGGEAIILHTRTIVQRYCLGMRRREVYEITAAKGLQTRRTAAANRASAARPIRARPHAIGASAADRDARHGGGTALLEPPPTQPPGHALLETPAAGNVMFLDLTKQIEQIKTLVKDVAVQVQHQQAPHVPEEFWEYYTQLTTNQVCPHIAAELMKQLQQLLRPEHVQRADFVKVKLSELVEKLLPVAGPITPTRANRPHIVALIGPTGVGKTTTIAKLAANLKLRDKHRVGLITIDTYRIAAIDQLKRYADIIGANLRVVANVEELSGAIESMSDCEFILIDTTGRSPNDTLKLGELRSFINLAKADEVHLVLSATSSQECVELAIERFGDVRIDKIIFTKLDETRKLGTVLNVVRKVNKPMSYVTTGQDVPDDIEVARGRRLAQLILGCEL